MLSKSLQPVSSLLSTKALKEWSLAIDEKIRHLFFFLCGSTKKANKIKIMNYPILPKMILLDLIWIKTSRKVFFKVLKKIDAGAAAPNS